MFIHLWMHWFWITAVHFKAFPFLTVYTISLSEAQLVNDTFAPSAPQPYNGNDSSQADHPPVIPSTLIHKDDHSPPTVRYLSSSSILQDDHTTARPDDSFAIAFASTSDIPDTFNGGTLDAGQYPHKKFTKHTHPKYARARTKGKVSNDTPGDGKIPDAKPNISITIADDGTAFPAPEVDRPFGGTTEIPSADVPDTITTIVSEENDTAEVDLTLEPALASVGDRKEVEILKNETLVIESKVEESRSYTTVEPFLAKNRVAAATSAHNYEVEQSELNPGSITGIILGILVVFSLFGAVSFVLYRRRYLNKPEVLHDKCSNLDSSGYIDETSLRENSEEMYSLDNDSFLNSLEAMTIQNYWTESVKHTKL